jgi:tetratricopeptide (TPR) repeat protein
MALVNVAYSLAKQGRRVLIVDFDLEAPGVTTFDLLRPKDSPQGLVDFVNAFADTGIAPDIREYVYECDASRADISGQIWVMPAGHADNYGPRFVSIDWQDLYESREGFMMFEDLRKQWDEVLKADYVLIDSRTGHTDISGICTRQLPDAVVVLFFPNDQNLDGLKKTVGDIRAHKNPLRDGPVALHFVASNVPNLDDEDYILQGRLNSFKAGLGYEDLAAQIHHYDSLVLLNQPVFVVERPRTKLANEYGVLTRSIMRANVTDALGVMDVLADTALGNWESGQRTRGGRPSTEYLEKIENIHFRDAQILRALAIVYQGRGELDGALRSLSTSLSLKKEPYALRDRAQIYQLKGLTTEAVADWSAVLKSDAIDATLFIQAVQALRVLDAAVLGVMPELKVFSGFDFDTRCRIGEQVLWEDTYELSKTIASGLLSEFLRAPSPTSIPHSLLLMTISHGWSLRISRYIDERLFDIGRLDISDAFNFAMAKWAIGGSPDIDLFKTVREKAPIPMPPGPNFQQCMALTSWVLGDKDSAERFLNSAVEASFVVPASFSVISYSYVHAPTFRLHAEVMKRAFKNDDLPAFEFMSHAQLSLPEFN